MKKAGGQDELRPYNPLEKRNLAESIVTELLQQAAKPLPPAEVFGGAGIYVIYYVGDYPDYRPIAERNREGRFDAPIYVGKAVPPGSRVGSFDADALPGSELFKRLQEHAESIDAAPNLSRDNFFCRFLVIDDIFIPLGESLLITRFQPIWNVEVKGFGNHTPGGGRTNQQPSHWDTLHPGRPWVANLTGKARDEEKIKTGLRQRLEKLGFPPPSEPVPVQLDIEVGEGG